MARCVVLAALACALLGASPATAEAGRGAPGARSARARAQKTWRSIRSFSPRKTVHKLAERRRAARDFHRYLERNPQVAEIYDEEKERSTVHVARRSVILSLSAAFISFAVSVASPVAGLSGLIALVQAENQVRNWSSKLMKARGDTLERARALSSTDPAVEAPDIASFLARDLVRAGDVPSQGQRAR